MKKFLLICLFCSMILMFGNIEKVHAVDTGDIQTKENGGAYTANDIKSAIEAYKKEDYLSCISTLKEYTERNDQNAVAWYYLGSSYMNIAMVKEASSAFDKVIALNTTPKLTSYAIQAELCMKNPNSCKYENFNPSEVKKLKENPTKFINDYYAALSQKAIKSDDVIQIENLIKGSYTNNIHPQAQDFILNERAKIKASQINSGKN